jgi:hypothetical protein
MEVVMHRKSVLATLTVLTLTLLVAPIFAKTFSRVVNLSKPARIGNAVLEPGDYQLTVEGSTITVVRDHQVVIKTEGRWESRGRSYGVTIISSGADGQIHEICFQGDHRVLVFSNAS